MAEKMGYCPVCDYQKIAPTCTTCPICGNISWERKTGVKGSRMAKLYYFQSGGEWDADKSWNTQEVRGWEEWTDTRTGQKWNKLAKHESWLSHIEWI